MIWVTGDTVKVGVVTKANLLFYFPLFRTPGVPVGASAFRGAPGLTPPLASPVRGYLF